MPKKKRKPLGQSDIIYKKRDDREGLLTCGINSLWRLVV